MKKVLFVQSNPPYNAGDCAFFNDEIAKRLVNNGKARYVPLTLGLRGETYIEVHGELAPGEQLIVGPYKTIRTLSDQDNVRQEKKKKEE